MLCFFCVVHMYWCSISNQAVTRATLGVTCDMVLILATSVAKRKVTLKLVALRSDCKGNC